MDFDFTLESITPTTPATELRLTIDTTSSIRVATGTTAQRPATPVAGDFRFNTTITNVEWYNGTTWAVAATGTVTSVTVDGTTNQIDSTGSPITSTGTITLTIPTVFIAPGTVQATSGFISAVAGLDYTTTLGNALTIQPGAAATTTSAGNLTSITGGAGGSTSGAGGSASVIGGTPTDGNGGAVNITGANGVGTDRSGGSVLETAGNATGTGTGGAVSLTAGSGGATGTAGNITLTSGAGGSTSGAAGTINLVGGTPVSGAGGTINITASAGVGTNQNGGNTVITAGARTGTGTPGSIDRVTTAGFMTFAGGNFSVAGDAKVFTAILRTVTTDAADTDMFLDGTGGTVRLVLPDDTTWAYRALISARRTDADNESAAYQYLGVIDRNTGAGTTALVGTQSRTVISEDNGAWQITAAADTTNGALRFFVNGQAAKNIRWVMVIEIMQVTG